KENGACPPSWRHGWKWSLTVTDSMPCASAATAISTSSRGSNCSADALKPSLRVMLFPWVSVCGCGGAARHRRERRMVGGGLRPTCHDLSNIHTRIDANIQNREAGRVKVDSVDFSNLENHTALKNGTILQPQ